ncbi:MAG TPA: group I intron-associated PD-(D/E)XK endonuclease [Terriglobales bacterium]|nr:group I intron-associated PD-(D/E)XK endonuclease [Terriglobales bacterium]
MSPNSITTFSHYKQQGEWAELLFMARAAEQGLAIARPWGDSSPYDVAIVSQSKPGTRPDFLRIQVKSTRCKHHNGYKCHIDSNRTAYRPDQLDFIAAYIITVAVWFIIPVHATCGQLELLLTPHRPTSKYGEYEEAWHLLHNEE